MTTKITITKIDEVHARVWCDPGVAEELSNYFAFRPAGYQYMPAFKSRVWDGWVRLFAPSRPFLKIGHVERLRVFCDVRDYELIDEVSVDRGEFTVEDATRFEETLRLTAKGKDIRANDHQIQAFSRAMTSGRCLLISPTASGKSLVMYMMIRKILDDDPGARILITVPTVNLVDQLWSDFKDYSSKNGWRVESAVGKVSGGRDKNAKNPVIISTWQSIFRLDDEWFEKFTTIVGDEAHTNKAKSLDTIMCKLRRADVRVGLTGTLNESEIDKLSLIGHFGEPFVVTTTKKLMDQGVVSKAKILMVRFSYPDKIKEALAKSGEYETEIGVVTNHVERNRKIAQMAVDFNRNPIVFFRRVEHGKRLADEIKKISGDSRRVFLMYGSTPPEEREKIRAEMNVGNDGILVASTGTFSTGGDIRNIGGAFMAHPLKGKITLMQSLGRTLRKSDDGKPVLLVDVVDDLRWKGRKNHSFKHGEIRAEHYVKEELEVKSGTIQLEEVT